MLAFPLGTRGALDQSPPLLRLRRTSVRTPFSKSNTPRLTRAHWGLYSRAHRGTWPRWCLVTYAEKTRSREQLPRLRGESAFDGFASEEEFREGSKLTGKS